MREHLLIHACYRLFIKKERVVLLNYRILKHECACWFKVLFVLFPQSGTNRASPKKYPARGRQGCTSSRLYRDKLVFESALADWATCYCSDQQQLPYGFLNSNIHCLIAQHVKKSILLAKPDIICVIISLKGNIFMDKKMQMKLVTNFKEYGSTFSFVN